MAYPTTPDLAGWLVGQLSTSTDLTDADVGTRRPPDTVNHAGLLVRVTVLGGPLDWVGHLWNPIVALECWGPSHDKAFDLCADATRELLALEGTVTDVLHLSEVDVMTALADTPIDGHPVVTTTANVTVELPVNHA